MAEAQRRELGDYIELAVAMRALYEAQSARGLDLIGDVRALFGNVSTSLGICYSLEAVGLWNEVERRALAGIEGEVRA